MAIFSVDYGHNYFKKETGLVRDKSTVHEFRVCKASPSGHIIIIIIIIIFIRSWSPWHTTQIQIERKKKRGIKKKKKKTLIGLHQATRNSCIIHIIFCISNNYMWPRCGPPTCCSESSGTWPGCGRGSRSRSGAPSAAARWPATRPRSNSPLHWCSRHSYATEWPPTSPQAQLAATLQLNLIEFNWIFKTWKVQRNKTNNYKHNLYNYTTIS